MMSHDAAIWSIDTSRYLPFTMTASADGKVRLANINRLGMRGKTTQAELFKVIYDPALKRFEFSEAKGLFDVNRLGSKYFLDTKSGVFRSVWNPQLNGAEYVASGGLGWVRVESVL